jgi:hypothetical protein
MIGNKPAIFIRMLFPNHRQPDKLATTKGASVIEVNIYYTGKGLAVVFKDSRDGTVKTLNPDCWGPHKSPRIEEAVRVVHRVAPDEVPGEPSLLIQMANGTTFGAEIVRRHEVYIATGKTWLAIQRHSDTSYLFAIFGQSAPDREWKDGEEVAGIELEYERISFALHSADKPTTFAYSWVIDYSTGEVVHHNLVQAQT